MKFKEFPLNLKGCPLTFKHRSLLEKQRPINYKQRFMNCKECSIANNGVKHLLYIYAMRLRRSRQGIYSTPLYVHVQRRFFTGGKRIFN